MFPSSKTSLRIHLLGYYYFDTLEGAAATLPGLDSRGLLNQIQSSTIWHPPSVEYVMLCQSYQAAWH